MHARAILRGCLIAFTAGSFLPLLLIAAAVSALSPDRPDWGRIVPVVLAIAFGVAVVLTGFALLAARFAARRRAEVWIGSAVLFGAGLGALCGALIGPLMIVLLFGAVGAATGLGAWLGAFGMRRRVRFGA
ncbi:hypothetical protein [Jannaschia formosa]|uniref:hypothetical protein n=1 Tax=Jannaschia formosa TaxID=2259592 RepID=UPI000E1B98F1|nr:hypothetical protein [Jannaschia formosa]TFL17704.1 hypothetical protein DR046_13680 [Jannaschia formosa]